MADQGLLHFGLRIRERGGEERREGDRYMPHTTSLIFSISAKRASTLILLTSLKLFVDRDMSCYTDLASWPRC
jgi:hypothetical protein